MAEQGINGKIRTYYKFYGNTRNLTVKYWQNKEYTINPMAIQGIISRSYWQNKEQHNN